jgi:hypothetical protein
MASAQQPASSGGNENCKIEHFISVAETLGALTVIVRADGTTIWDGRPVADDELESLMDKSANSMPKQMVLVLPECIDALGNNYKQVWTMANSRGIAQKLGVIAGRAE